MVEEKFKICNIATDEKFIDGAIESLDLFSDKWDMQWIVCNINYQGLKFIKRYPDRVTKVSEDRVIDYIVENEFDALILHSFCVISPSVIIKIPNNIKVFWFGWGYDIYNFPAQKPFLKWNLYKPLTNRYINPSFYKIFRQFASKIKFVLKGKNRVYEKALNRIDYFAGVVELEYDLLKRNPKFKAQKVVFSYSSLAGLKSHENYEKFNANNILVGNSAAATNNHLDFLEYLKQIDLNGKKVIMPLSYAGSADYVNTVIKCYKNALGDNVIPLTDFMPFDEYKRYILSCSASVFFMERQQAMGNIGSALKYGCKVYLSKKNPVYQYYKDLGMTIFTVESDFNNSNISIPLTDVEIEQNRTILKKLHDYDAYIGKLNTIYEALR